MYDVDGFLIQRFNKKYVYDSRGVLDYWTRDNKVTYKICVIINTRCLIQYMY